MMRIWVRLPYLERMPMNISSIAALATQMTNAQNASSIAFAVLGKALDVQAETVAQLIESIDLGQNLDVQA